MFYIPAKPPQPSRATPSGDYETGGHHMLITSHPGDELHPYSRSTDVAQTSPAPALAPRPRILLGVTADQSHNLMQGFPAFLAGNGWDVHLVSTLGPMSTALSEANTPYITVHTIRMERSPNPFRDLHALIKWCKLLSSIRPDIVSSGTPKAGLLGGVAGFLTHVPRRIYVLRGLRYETAHFPLKLMLKALERMTIHLAHETLTVSASLIDLAVIDRLSSRRRFKLVGAGSSNGVNIDRFESSASERLAVRHHRWSKDDQIPVIGFIGRLHPDKGVRLLTQALEHLVMWGVHGRLLLIGGSDGLESEALEAELIATGFPVDFVGAVTDVAPYMKLIDILCLPTKREGFPNVVLEAAAAGVPTVATTATGIRDAIVHEETGLICERRDSVELAHALSQLITDSVERRRLGKNAQERATNLYSQSDVWRSLHEYYSSWLQS